MHSTHHCFVAACMKASKSSHCWLITGYLLDCQKIKLGANQSTMDCHLVDRREAKSVLPMVDKVHLRLLVPSSQTELDVLPYDPGYNSRGEAPENRLVTH